MFFLRSACEKEGRREGRRGGGEREREREREFVYYLFLKNHF